MIDRVLFRGPASADGESERMTLLEHLEALRRVLIISALAMVVGSTVAFFFRDQMFLFLAHQAGIRKLYVLSPLGEVTASLKLSVIVGAVIASPVILQQIWWFISPGLHLHERRLALPLLVGSVAFFFMGIAFAVWALHLFIRILDSFGGGTVGYFPEFNSFLSFLLLLTVAFGFVFELPVVLVALGLLRVITSKWLWQHRFYWIIGLQIVANLMTPGVDPITPQFLFIPLVLFYLGSILVLRVLGR